MVEVEDGSEEHLEVVDLDGAREVLLRFVFFLGLEVRPHLGEERSRRLLVIKETKISKYIFKLIKLHNSALSNLLVPAHLSKIRQIPVQHQFLRLLGLQRFLLLLLLQLPLSHRFSQSLVFSLRVFQQDFFYFTFAV